MPQHHHITIELGILAEVSGSRCILPVLMRVNKVGIDDES